MIRPITTIKQNNNGRNDNYIYEKSSIVVIINIITRSYKDFESRSGDSRTKRNFRKPNYHRSPFLSHTPNLEARIKQNKKKTETTNF